MQGRTVIKHMEELLGKGIFNSDHEQWKVQRKVASHEFSSAVLRDFSTAVFKEHSVKLLRIISDYAEANRSMDLQVPHQIFPPRPKHGLSLHSLRFVALDLLRSS